MPLPVDSCISSTKINALLWLAVDPRTPEGEAQAALAALRRMELAPSQVQGKLSIPAQERPRFFDPVMPFGQFSEKAGNPKRLSQIADEQPSYLWWLLDQEWLNPSLREQIEL